MLPALAGVGNRGSSAVSRLVQNGKLSGAEMWCLDHDRKLLDTMGNANKVVVRKEEPHMVPLHIVTFDKGLHDKFITTLARDTL